MIRYFIMMPSPLFTRKNQRSLELKRQRFFFEICQKMTKISFKNIKILKKRSAKTKILNLTSLIKLISLSFFRFLIKRINPFWIPKETMFKWSYFRKYLFSGLFDSKKKGREISKIFCSSFAQKQDFTEKVRNNSSI